jgi:hypothetical protein
MSGVTLAAASGPATDQRQQQQQKKSPATILRIYGAANRRERPFISLFGSVQHSRPFFYFIKENFTLSSFSRCKERATWPKFVHRDNNNAQPVRDGHFFYFFFPLPRDFISRRF